MLQNTVSWERKEKGHFQRSLNARMLMMGTILLVKRWNNAMKGNFTFFTDKNSVPVIMHGLLFYLLNWPYSGFTMFFLPIRKIVVLKLYCVTSSFRPSIHQSICLSHLVNVMTSKDEARSSNCGLRYTIRQHWPKSTFACICDIL